ncbi:MAG: ABC transporter permease, partial [Lewinella sp.]|nr:ABC transporter permease [Lewinella sp.]
MDRQFPDRPDVRPPKWADRFLQWYCAPELLDEIQGDLHEAFYHRIKKVGLRKAKFLFIKEVLLFCRPSSFRRSIAYKNHPVMYSYFKNYLKVAFRNFYRNGLYTFINGFGLALGLSCSLLILLWVHFESNVDHFHPEGDRIYRAYFNGLSPEGEVTFTQGAGPYALYHLFQEYDGVEKPAYFEDDIELILAMGEQAYMERGAWGSPSVFETFDFPLLAGSIGNSEKQLETIYISEDLAKKFFGEDWLTESVGAVLRVNDDREETIAGVFRNIGSNSSLQFDFLLNIEQVAEQYPNWAQGWGNKGAMIFAKLAPGVAPSAVEGYVNPIYKDTDGYGVGGDAMMLFPFEDNYLWTKFEQGIASGGKIQYMRIFFGAAMFLILIACINFVNLSTALSSKRAREVGIRKAVGAQRNNILFQFLSETGLLVFMALLGALLLDLLLLPLLNGLTGQTIAIPWQQPAFWLTILGLGVALTFVAGLYPAFVISLYRPVKVLKTGALKQKGSLSLRKSLVVFQFVLSSILIISTITVHNQLNLIQHENLGLDRSNVLVLPINDRIGEQYDVLKDKLLQSSAISEVLRSTSAPVDINWINVGYEWEGKLEDQSNYFYRLNTEASFADVFDIEMADGRFFKEDMVSDTAGVVINETGVTQMQMEDPVGKMITDKNSGERLRILGIMKDFNFKSIHREIEPLLIRLAPRQGRKVMIKTKAGGTQATITQLQSVWSELFPGYPLEYDFLDDTYNQLYKSEMMIGKLVYVFATIAIVISCLGLFGLITFIALQRTKEIGIRKVLGASVNSIVGLLSRDFLLLVTIGLLIAAPLAWYLMEQWLQGFA